MLIRDVTAIEDGNVIYQRYKDWCNINAFAATLNRTFYTDLKNKNITTSSGKIEDKRIRNIVHGFRLSNCLSA